VTNSATLGNGPRADSSNIPCSTSVSIGSMVQS
jgi:hypothetical protein